MKSEGWRAVDVGNELDRGAWSPAQKRALMLAALPIVFDGFDIQIVAFAIPALATEWSVRPAAFALALACGLIGMSIGTVLAGALGDRVGRRKILIFSTCLFGLLTLSTGAASSLTHLCILRFIAGLGMGGAMPNATALIAEFTPLKQRSMAISLGIICIPIGGTLGAVTSSWILPAFGWHALFIVGGAFPLLAAAFLIRFLPESPRFLARQKARSAQLAEMLNRFAGYRRFTGDEEFTEGTGTSHEAGLGTLFSRAFRHDTIALWAAFFCCLVSVYTFFNWIPALLSSVGLGLRSSSQGAAAFNLGGVAGALVSGLLIKHWGSRPVLLSMSAGAIVGALALGLLSATGASVASLMLGLSLEGAFVNAVQIGLFALAAHVYPTSCRATGIGWALGAGRIGAILSAFGGAAMLSVWPGGTGYFMMIAAVMVLTLVAIALVRRHVPSVAA